jgi:hypothetical protein
MEILPNISFPLFINTMDASSASRVNHFHKSIVYFDFAAEFYFA